MSRLLHTRAIKPYSFMWIIKTIGAWLHLCDKPYQAVEKANLDFSPSVRRQASTGLTQKDEMQVRKSRSSWQRLLSIFQPSATKPLLPNDHNEAKSPSPRSWFSRLSCCWFNKKNHATAQETTRRAGHGRRF